eukprot:5480846-Pyramimonas_sp.AAC.1
MCIRDRASLVRRAPLSRWPPPRHAGNGRAATPSGPLALKGRRGHGARAARPGPAHARAASRPAAYHHTPAAPRARARSHASK